MFKQSKTVLIILAVTGFARVFILEFSFLKISLRPIGNLVDFSILPINGVMINKNTK